MANVRDKVVTFKVSEDELEMIKRGAESENMSQSDYCRSCVVRDRLIEGDPTAIKIVKGNIAAYVKTSEEALEDMIDKLVKKMAELKNSIQLVDKPKRAASE